MFRAVLSNPLHPEHGQATVPFPLREDVYPQTLELLRTLDLGNPTGRDCQIDEISGGYSVLKRLEGGMSNLDELDYLAKRLELSLIHIFCKMASISIYLGELPDRPMVMVCPEELFWASRFQRSR